MARFAFAHRGVMLDMARLIERHEYYFSLPAQLKSWGFNLIHLHLCDDQYCALRFPSHPELASSHAFSADEMKEFCWEARKNGLEVVPEVECFGHAGFIIRHKTYRHLAEDSAPGSGFTGMCVFHSDTKALLQDLLRDTAEIFEPRLIHAGLDEVSFGSHPTSRKLLKKKTKGRLFADHINWVHRTVEKFGCRLAIWGDHLLHDETGVIAARTPRDTLIFDWHYAPDYRPDTMDFFVDRGFEVYGVPSTNCWRNRILSGSGAFRNLRIFSGAALLRRPKGKIQPGRKGGVTGMVNSVWCPSRYVPGTIEYPLALAGKLFTDAGPEPEGFAVAFARSFWGLKGTAARELGRTLQALHEAAPDAWEYERIVFGCTPGNPKDGFSRYDADLARRRLAIVRAAALTFRQTRGEVCRNADRFDDYITAAKFLETIYHHASMGRKGDPGWATLQKAMRDSWRRTRYPEGPHYTGKTPQNHWRKTRKDPFGASAAIMRDLNYLARK